jgi:hypothetical protein
LNRLSTAVVLASLLALLPLPGIASAAKRRAPQPRYVVSLTGSVRLKWSETEEGLEPGPPLGCLGHGSETLSLAASAKIAAKPAPTSLGYYGRNFPFILFKAALKSQSAQGSIQQSASSFTPNVNEPFPPTAAECAFTPKQTVAKCAFEKRSELEAGEYFQISPDLNGNPTAPLQRSARFFIYDGQPLMVGCNSPRLSMELLGESVGVPTTLRVGRVLSLPRGKSLRDSGSASFPAIGSNGKAHGTQTVAFSVAVRRVS